MKTMAIRLEDDVHAQLVVLAQLEGLTLIDEIRQAIESHIERKRAEGGFTEKAAAALEEIERDAAARRQAIQTLFGESKTDAEASSDAKPARGRAAAKPTSE